MKNYLERVAWTMTIFGCVLGSVYFLGQKGQLSVYAQQGRNTEEGLDDRIVQLQTFSTREILRDFTFVQYNNKTRSDNLQNILQESDRPAVVYFFDEDERSSRGILSKNKAIVLSEVRKNNNIIRFIGFSISTIPGTEKINARYFADNHNVIGLPETKLYVPTSVERGREFITIDDNAGAPLENAGIKTSIIEIPEYWFEPNLFSTGKRTVYRFLRTHVWNELNADGLGNILDSDGHIVGQDVDPALVRLWTEGRALRNESER